MTDSSRTSRTHLVNVKLDRSGAFRVILSDGTEWAWDDWCRWIRDDLRATFPTRISLAASEVSS
jgi:hypothetical protein